MKKDIKESVSMISGHRPFDMSRISLTVSRTSSPVDFSCRRLDKYKEKADGCNRSINHFHQLKIMLLQNIIPLIQCHDVFLLVQSDAQQHYKGIKTAI